MKQLVQERNRTIMEIESALRLQSILCYVALAYSERCVKKCYINSSRSWYFEPFVTLSPTPISLLVDQ